MVFVSPRRMMEVMGHVRGAGGRGGDMERSLEGQLMEEEEVPHHHMRWRQMNGGGRRGGGGERNGVSGEANANLGEK